MKEKTMMQLRPELEEFLSEKFCREYKTRPEGVQLRQLLPQDINRPNWLWEKTGSFEVAAKRIVAITGLGAMRLVQVDFFQPTLHGNKVGMFTNGNSAMALILSEKEKVSFKVSYMDEWLTDPASFVLMGIVAEFLGAEIAP